MAYKITEAKRNLFTGEIERTIVCDTVDDVASLPKSSPGSTALIRKGGKLYMVDASGEWGFFGESEEE